MVNYREKAKKAQVNYKKKKARGFTADAVGLDPLMLSPSDRGKYVLLMDILRFWRQSTLNKTQFSKEIGEDESIISIMLKLDYSSFDLDEIQRVHRKITVKKDSGP